MKRSYLAWAVLVLASLTLASCAKSGQKPDQSGSSTSSSAQVKKNSSNSSSNKKQEQNRSRDKTCWFS